jgi:threonine/homoserine/homoserine lactone efflux protein
MHTELRILLTLIGVYVPVLVSPGPNFLVVTQVAVSQSRRHAIVTALGVSSASTILAVIAATGVGILMMHFAWLQNAVRIIGGFYLGYVGVKIWRHATQPLTSNDSGQQTRSLSQLYWYGLTTNLSNPKSLVFFSTMFASMLTTDLPVWVRIAGVCSVSLVSTTWNLSVANWFSGQRMRLAFTRARTPISRMTACVLLVVGIKLLIDV